MKRSEKNTNLKSLDSEKDQQFVFLFTLESSDGYETIKNDFSTKFYLYEAHLVRLDR